MLEQNKNGKPIRCDCGKLIAFERQGKVFIKCKACKREFEIRLPEPRAKSQEP